MGQDRKETRHLFGVRVEGPTQSHCDYGTLIDQADLLFYLNIKKHSVSSQTDGNPNDEPNEPSLVYSMPSSVSDYGAGDSVGILGLPSPSDLPDDRNLKMWNMNYHEASIYLQVLDSFDS